MVHRSGTGRQPGVWSTRHESDVTAPTRRLLAPALRTRNPLALTHPFPF